MGTLEEKQQVKPVVDKSVPPDTMLAYSIMAVIGWFPIGIMALIFSIKCGTFINEGNLAKAHRCSENARTLCYLAGSVFAVYATLFVTMIVLAVALN